MRITLYAGRLPEPGQKPGGVDVFVHRLSQALVARGHDVEVLTASAAPADANYRVAPIYPRAAGATQLRRQYLAPWLLNRRSFADRDVVHFHGDDWFFWARDVPTVRTFHGSSLMEARTATTVLRRINTRVLFGLELLAARLATASYAVGVDSQVVFGARGLLPLGVDIPDLGDQQRCSEPTIMFIGTWSGRKRGSFLADVFHREVRPVIPNAHLVMVSDYCETRDGISWMRAPSDVELTAALRRAWVFCSPSTYEGLGIPYLEAMANGVPIVATRNYGAESLLAGGCGAIVDDQDLGRSLVSMLSDSALREFLSRAGLARARDYSWDEIIDRHELAYADAIARWSARRAPT
jgi:glycosyltransferase involved in cell wall biosynthesis